MHACMPSVGWQNIFTYAVWTSESECLLPCKWRDSLFFSFPYNHFYHHSTIQNWHPPLLSKFNCNPLACSPATICTCQHRQWNQREGEKGGMGAGVVSAWGGWVEGRLIIKLLQLASPWRSGTWRGFRGFSLSTSDLMQGMEDCGSQSPWSPPASLWLLLLSHSCAPLDTPPPICPLCPQSS